MVYLWNGSTIPTVIIGIHNLRHNHFYISFLHSGNCDSVSGECFKCLNNTDGDRCQYCKEGFYGDAVELKNCQDCQCDACGSEITPCNRTVGQCQCKPNIEGKRCDKCKVPYKIDGLKIRLPLFYWAHFFIFRSYMSTHYTFESFL